MRRSPTLPALALASVVLLGACGGGGDDLANVTDEGSSPSQPTDAGDSSDGVPDLFELSACDSLSAEDLTAAGFEPEPSNRAGEAGDSTGNVCWWEGGLGNARTANYFEEVISDDETEVDGRPARRITGKDDLEAVDAYPACGVRIEVESGVIVEMEVSVGQTEHYSTEDEPRLAEACAILDVLVPAVSARIAGGDGPPSAD